tara:strand:- start:377 stop:916 length:540 start_codon:yes stop_codon:yes gene_type:complete
MQNYKDFQLEQDFKNIKDKNALNLLEKLHDFQYDFQIFSHPPLRTVEEAKKFRKNFEGGFTKNLFLRDKKKKNFLITLEENQPINLKELPQIISSDRLSFASPERLFEFLKVIPGSVSPLSLINDKELEVSFFIDANLLRNEKLNFHPLINTLTISILYKDFLKFLDFTKHKLNYLNLN